jgi:hypothetical protein
MLNDGQESTKEDHCTEACRKKGGKTKRKRQAYDHSGKDSVRITQVHSLLAMNIDCKNENLSNDMKGITMKSLSLRRVLSLAMCLCLAVTLLSAFSLTRSAHAATAKANTCQTLPFAPGKFILYASDPYKQWTTCKGTTMALHMQPDGNFVLYANGQAVWASNSSGLGVSGDVAEFQTDGNLVVYDIYTVGCTPGPVCAAWASSTRGKSAAKFELQSDGNMVIYNTSGKAIWASGTSGH